MAIKSIEITNLTNNQLYGFRMFPRNLKGQYQTRDDRGTATATPKAIDPIFGNNSWEVIDSVSRSGNIPSTWHVGDTKDITLTTGETLTMQIYGFKHDDLTSGGKAGITLGMKNLMAGTMRMNSQPTNSGGFIGSKMYSWLQNELFDTLPYELKSNIKNIDKDSHSMKIFLLSNNEIFSDYKYEYFKVFGDTVLIKSLKNGTGNSFKWWLRTSSTDRYSFNGITDYGGKLQSNADNNLGVCFGFCI